MSLQHLPKQVGLHEPQTERGGECWGKPLSWSGLVMRGDDGSEENNETC